MKPTSASLPKGPALLARAGVELADAQWLYRQQRGGTVGIDPPRLAAIRRKVHSFVVAGAVGSRVGAAAA